MPHLGPFPDLITVQPDLTLITVTYAEYGPVWARNRA